MTDKVRIKRALISVSDKEGIVEFAQGLQSYKVEIVSTGGTARKLEKGEVKVTPVSAITRFPEMLDGRVKTLHPAIHGGLLAVRESDDHMKQLKEQEIEPIDMVVVNLYPFAETVAKEGVKLEEAIEQIDIGGPSMLRSAAKNFDGVAVVVNPARYKDILKELEGNGGALTRKTRLNLAKEAFRHTALYDTNIYNYLGGDRQFSPLLSLSYEKIQDLRYGENPHQSAAYYREEGAPGYSLVFARKLHGKELSFNNILDLEAAWAIVREFTVPAAAVIKHTNPCGTALADTIATAYARAHGCDPVSAFGSVVALNRVVDKNVAQKISQTFVEAVIAPAYVEEALEILTKKENIRLMYIGEEREPQTKELDMRRVDGGILLQDLDTEVESRKDMKVVTKREPTDDEWGNLLFAWKVAKHVKSNAIVLSKGLATIGVGAGQMSRVDASELAVKKAGKKNCKEAVLASDAFFPFEDALEAAAKVGITVVIQPGGAKRDKQVIAAADKNNIAMVFTGKRHFKH